MMRLAGISDMAAAQALLPGFMARHSAKFAVAPRDAEDAHKPQPLDPLCSSLCTLAHSLTSRGIRTGKAEPLSSR